MRYFAYIRKSSKEKNRQTQSIPKQYDWVKKEALRKKIKIEKFFEDSQSGHKLGRDGFEKMIEEIEKSETPIGIITWKISRLSRNPIDEGIIKYAFMRKKIQHIIARDREYKEGESQIIMGVDFGQATQYSIELSKDVIEGMGKKICKGYRPTKAPYGYINDPTGIKGQKKILIDEVYFKPIQQFLKMFSTGLYSVSELQQIMTEKWRITNRAGKPFSTSTLYLILRRRFYCGQYFWNGEIEQGKHKPMITLEEHLNILKLLNRKKKFSKNKYENHYSGQIKCGSCQSTFTGYSKVKNNLHKGLSTYHYLKCTKSKKVFYNEKNINRNSIDKQVLKILNTIHISDKILNQVLLLYKIHSKKNEQDIVVKKGQLKKKRNALDGELEVLTRKLSKGILTDNLFLKMSKNIETEISLINEKLKKLDKQNDFEKIKQFFLFLNKAKNRFENGSYVDKKCIIQTLGSNLCLKGGILSLELQIPFLILQKDRIHNQIKNSQIELQKNRSTTKQNGNLTSENVLWSSSWEELRTSILSNSFIIHNLIFFKK